LRLGSYHDELKAPGLAVTDVETAVVYATHVWISTVAVTYN
jgi:hypothetical protein